MRSRSLAAVSSALTCLVGLGATAAGQTVGHRPLGATEIDAIARLEMMEDRRQLDSADVTGLLAAPHPEVRRRAALAVARIPADKRGVALLRARPLDADTAVAATIVFAVGQLRDTATVAWFDSLVSSPRTAPTVATEAAVALGKIKTAAAREVLARYLDHTVATARTTPVLAEALLSIGRSTARGDIAPIVRWTHSPNEELRWRATWALFRPRDPAAVPALIVMSDDASPLVRSWAVRGLGKPQADSAMAGAKGEARLLAATHDADRRVRTEAVRALGTYTDSAATAALVVALASADTWISVSAAEGLGRIRAAVAIPRLVAATGVSHSCALRITAMQALQTYALPEAIAAAADVARDTVPYCATTARQAHFTMVDAALEPAARRAARRADLASSDLATRAMALRSMTTWADTTDLAALLDAYDRAQSDSLPAAASAAVAAIAAVQRRHGVGSSQFFARFAAPANESVRRGIDRAFGAAARHAWPAVVRPQRELADYRRIVERWIVPDYNGAPRPRARWETPRGGIDVELYPGDAPLAVDDFVRTMESGAIVGTEFSRVVPDFVDQQRTIRDGNVLRDEVNRHRLTRANLAWATAGLDTGSPGYTLNHTPQPHNEGDFTSLGRVIRGMDAVDRLELGDRISAAKMLPNS
jgi:HEAT repeat protein/cyclophilin family peptidyl-prolyl cis-trans isomerase